MSHAREFAGRVALFVQSQVTLERIEDGPVASGGISLVWDPWTIDHGELDPIAYEYTAPEQPA